MQRRFVQRPFQPSVPYIQRGGGIFSSIADVAKRYVLPFFTKAAKQTGESFLDVGGPDIVKGVIDHAKKAVEDGLRDASGKILQGENVGETIKNVTNKTKDSITDKLKTEASKVGAKLQKRKKEPYLSPAKEPPPKKARSGPAQKKKKRKSTYLAKPFSTLPPGKPII